MEGKNQHQLLAKALHARLPPDIASSIGGETDDVKQRTHNELYPSSSLLEDGDPDKEGAKKISRKLYRTGFQTCYTGYYAYC